MKQIFNFVFVNCEHSRPFAPIKQILWKIFFVAGILFNGNQEKLQGFLRKKNKKKTDPFWELQNLIKVLSWFKKERTSESDVWFVRRGKNTDWQTEAAGGTATCEGGKEKSTLKFCASRFLHHSLSGTSPVSSFISVQSLSFIYLPLPVDSSHHSSLFFL